jgi:hypothetical protein
MKKDTIFLTSALFGLLCAVNSLFCMEVVEVSMVCPYENGMTLLYKNKKNEPEGIDLPLQESKRLIDSFRFRNFELDIKAKITVDYNGKNYEVIFDSIIHRQLEDYKKTMKKAFSVVNEAGYPAEKYTGTRRVTLFLPKENSQTWLKSTKWIGGGIATAAFFFSIFYYMYKNGVSFGDVAVELTKMLKFKA